MESHIGLPAGSLLLPLPLSLPLSVRLSGVNKILKKERKERKEKKRKEKKREEKKRKEKKKEKKIYIALVDGFEGTKLYPK